MFRHRSALFRRKLASSDDVNSFSAGVLSQGSHSEQLVSSLVGFLPSEQEKLVLNSALTGKDWIVFEVNSGRNQSHVAYLQHIQFR